jgi:pyruvate/2-oxoglutarate/acetoin dehydrogenase E1 component/TPP-dependent pyruvate/acetoin dehydrogenase alpha subunit
MTEKTTMSKKNSPDGLSGESFRQEVLEDFHTACLSREASLLARREVLTGKAKFGITGDGKEVPQLALAHSIRKGDWRAGYYRDQTMMFALGLSTVEDFFAQLYADPENDPFSGGRQMNGHFATPTIDRDGAWLRHPERINISSDISPTGGQMARGLGLAMASRKYRELPGANIEGLFSDQGNEICFCTIGDASTSEGVFWESINAAGVMQVPMAIQVWDDGYGISVPIDYQTTKKSISKVLSGFQAEEHDPGLDIYVAPGWDYLQLRKTYTDAIPKIRETHIPALFHINELTQPQGHSTSGSHERYKSPERLEWEREYDCINQMGLWMIASGICDADTLEQIREKARKEARAAKDRAWKAFTDPVKLAMTSLKTVYEQMTGLPAIDAHQQALGKLLNPQVHEVVANARRAWFDTVGTSHPARAVLKAWLEEREQTADRHYHSHLYSQSEHSALRVPLVPPVYSEESPVKNGFEILNAAFDQAFERNPSLLAFGEDVGHIGGVNQAFSGLQEKYGIERIFDTGIREWTIMGQAIGLAMRGFRPIAEIQYLDYLIYGMEPLSDDLATLHYRTVGKQKAPAIIRTRGHRLEGIWHAGSPLGMIIHALRGMHVLVPRNMTQAAGFYNTLLRSDDPGLVIECLNGYRLKERLPDNVGEFTVPLGVPEILHEGTDVSIITYGSCVRIAQAALPMLEAHGISVDLIDVQTLLPFDLEHRILESVKKTNRIIFLDEDVPGGATAYMMQQVLEVQGGYRYMDSAPTTLCARPHRPPYGSDGDYFSKPSAEDVFLAAYRLVYESDPQRLPGEL